MEHYEFKPRRIGMTVAFVAGLYANLIQQGSTTILSIKQDERQIERYKDMLKKSYGLDVSHEEIWNTRMKMRFLQDLNEFEPHGTEFYNETKFVGYKLTIIKP